MRRNRFTETAGAMGILRLQRSGMLASANLSETSFRSPHFQRYIFLLFLCPSVGKGCRGLDRMSKLFPNPGTLPSKAWFPWEQARVPKAFFMRKIRLLICRGGTSGPETAPMALGWKGQSQI